MARLTEKKTNFIDGVCLNKRAIKLLKQICPHLVLCEIFNGIIKGVFPFLEITFAAMIINELVGEKNINILIKLVLFALFSLFIAGVLREILNKIVNAKKEIFDEQHEIFLNSYSYNMDFQRAEDVSTTELRDRIQGIMDTEEGGLKNVYSWHEWFRKNNYDQIVVWILSAK